MVYCIISYLPYYVNKALAYSVKYMAASRGVEPLFTGSKPDILPLDEEAMLSAMHYVMVCLTRLELVTPRLKVVCSTY